MHAPFNRSVGILVLLSAMSGCGDKEADADGLAVTPDADGDGFDADVDCDDANNTIFPGAEERCNGLDDDCDELIDEDAVNGATWYRDADEDSYGDPDVTDAACEQPLGFVSDGTDCDDTDPAIHPTAAEDDCTDPVDYNCDGSVGYADADADGVPACEDCDDGDAAVSPSAAEVCNEIDDDCDGAVDEAGSVGETIFFADSDGDGYGDAATWTAACDPPSGHVADATDCDDTSALASPVGTEVCDGLDNNCDGQTDDASAADASAWYPDGDGDGHGAAAPSVTACDAPASFVATSDDCDDSDAEISPSGTESCNTIDDDCDGDVDEGLTGTYYADPDGDGYGVSGTSVTGCDPGAGFATVTGDCDEGDPAVNPGAAEVCDERDNDCDGDADDADASLDTRTAESWYADADCDGHGDPLDSLLSCAQPSGYISDDSDCDDDDASVNPGGVEIWYDGVDADCDGGSDYDADGDGYDSVVHGGVDEDDQDPTCWTGCTPGLTQADAAASCVDILAVDPSAPDATYWIDPDDDGDTSNAFEVYCDMNNGGWALCFELENTTAEDLTNNSWFDDCVDYTEASWTGAEVRVLLEDASGTVLYDEAGDHAGVAWSYNQLTSTTSSGSQYYSYDHDRLVTLGSGDKLMISGRDAGNAGCGGSMGNGYGIVIYPSSPDYYSNPKMFVFPYMLRNTAYTSSPYRRDFSGWSTSNEISYNGGASFNSCSSTPAQIGTFTFWVR
ncbi:MAG: MopE-related protein [Myxococcota bacterium]|nr:MopE-related protein [Myxococcota bacterium]